MIKKLLYIIIIVSSIVTSSCERDKKDDLKDILYVKRAGAEMPAYIYGDASNDVFVVLLHGGPGASGLDYRLGSYAKDLEDKYAMVYYDQRGQGLSQGNFGVKDVHIDSLVLDVKALVEVLKFKYGSEINLFLMGHSWGGTLGTAVLLTEDFQDLFNGWIEVDGAHDFPLLFESALDRFKEIGQAQINESNNEVYWEEVLDSINALNPQNVDFSYMNREAYIAEARLTEDGVIALPELILKDFPQLIFWNNPITTFLAGRITSIQIYRNDLIEVSYTSQLRKIQLPTLLLWGKYDLVVPLQLGESAYENIGSEDKQLIIFEKSGHSPMVTESDIFVSSVIDFIDRNI